MKKWLMLILVVITMTTILTATTIKVAVLPLKRLDSASKYIQNIMKVRDLVHTFQAKANTKYELLDLTETAAIMKENEITDIDEMDKEDLAALSKALNTDVLLRGTINAFSAQEFDIDFRFYSARTDEIKSVKSRVPKDKKKRWAKLETDIFETLDKFISDEAAKIATMAMQDYQSEDYVNAEKKFVSILNYNPNDYTAQLYLGLIAYKQKNYDKAINLLTVAFNALEKDKANTTNEYKNQMTSLLQNMVDVYRDAKNTAKMMEKQEQIAAFDKDKEMWLSIANAYALDNQKSKARAALKEALKIDKDYMNAIIRMAILLYEDGSYVEAIPFLERVVDEAPENQQVGKLLANAYQKTGRISEAIAKYEKLLVADPSNLQGYKKLAELYRAATLDATDKNVIDTYNLKAIETLNRLKAIDPNDAEMYLMLADAYLATDRVSDAETNANIAISRESSSKENSQYQPYMILASLNQRKGIEKYNQFVDLDKQFQKAFGGTANRLDKERKAAKAAANGLFRKSQENLLSAKSKTVDDAALSEINSKLSGIVQLIGQTTN